MQAFWDERYAAKDYAYGTAPNAFLAEKLPGLPTGRALFPAEGEGRNAAYAAELGWKVDAFDYSKSAREKAMKLFAERQVSVQYELSSVEAYAFETAAYDLVFLCFAHLPPPLRAHLHKQAAQALKPGGLLLLEGFHTDQLPRSSGGPKRAEMLFSTDGLAEEFPGLETEQLERVVTVLAEGPYHRGEAVVVRMQARKPR